MKENDIIGGRISVLIFFLIASAVAVFTSWIIPCVYVISISLILYKLTMNNIREKHQRPLDRSFGQIGQFLDIKDDNFIMKNKDVIIGTIYMLLLIALVLYTGYSGDWGAAIFLLFFILIFFTMHACVNFDAKRKNPIISTLGQTGKTIKYFLRKLWWFLKLFSYIARLM